MAFQISSPTPCTFSMETSDGAFGTAWRVFACTGAESTIELEQRDLLTDIVYGVILVTLLGQGLTLRVLLPRWKEKLVRAEVEEPLPSKA